MPATAEGAVRARVGSTPAGVAGSEAVVGGLVFDGAGVGGAGEDRVGVGAMGVAGVETGAAGGMVAGDGVAVVAGVGA
jgi:hypothetical protein